MKEQRYRWQRMAAQLIVTLLLVPSIFAFGTSQDEASAIAVHMKAINQSFRELRRNLNDPDKMETNLALIAELKKHFLGAKKEEPGKTLALPEGQRTSFLVAYRAQLDQVIATLDQLDESVRKNRLEEAEALVKQLNALKKDGHEKFQE